MKSIVRKYHYGSNLALVLLIFVVSSCSYNGNNLLFRNNRTNDKKSVTVLGVNKDSILNSDYKHRIKPGDRILVSFLNNYDIGSAAYQSATSTANFGDQASKGYLVNYDSTITLPLIGRTNIVGLTRLEAAKRLELEYGKFIINPIIEVNIVNLSATILGEVNAPGKVFLDKETTTLVDILALSGGIKDVGRKNKIKIIRDKQTILVDLSNINALESKVIQIQDGDIIYVQPYGFKAATESLGALQSTSILLLSITQLTLVTLQVITFSKTF